LGGDLPGSILACEFFAFADVVMTEVFQQEETRSRLSKEQPLNLETNIAETAKLLQSIKVNLPALEELLEATDDWEDIVYRFYHQSFKVCRAQGYTEAIAAKLQQLAPHLPLNSWFMVIVRAGTGREFTPADNDQWTTIARPMLEALAHARYFLEMACKYGKELASPAGHMPSGWASVLYLYNLR
jgi:hypothetical protein